MEAFDVINCSLINKRFYVMYSNELLWKGLFENMFCHIKRENNFYDNYKKHIKLDIDIIKEIISDKEYDGIWLDHKFITYLSPQIGRLNNLKSLLLCGNEIKTIPIELCKLINLENLDISHNKLEFIPPEIERLVKLKELKINNNRLKVIPPEIGNLKYLKKLAIYHIQTQIIPPELGKLKKLRTLYLTDEQFENRPKEINKIKHLKCYLHGDEWK